MTERCIDPAVGEKLGAYELGLLGAADRRAVEAHLVACESCRDGAYEAAPTATLLTGDARGVLRELTREAPARASWLDALRASLRSPRALVPAAALAALALVVLLRSPGPDPAALARVDPLPWTPLAVRDAPRPADALFERAMASYADADWTEAAQTLRAALAEDDGLAGSKRDQAQLYLGVSLLLTDDPPAAIAPLGTAAESALPVLADRALWYLAQAHLLRGDSEAARATLARLVRSPGYADAAADQLRRLE